MLANFKKVGVAAAVAAVLGASGAAQAITLGHPGDALLIPFVGTDGLGSSNTMISIVAASPGSVNVRQFSTLTPGPKDGCGVPNAQIHWYYFNNRSREVANGTLPVTCDDWVGIDWASVVATGGNPTNPRPITDALGQIGYMVIADNAASPTRASGLILYGTAYQIYGNWATQAYIPVLPLRDDLDSVAIDEVTHVGTTVTNVIPVQAGMQLPSTGSIAVGNDTARFSLRYYLGGDPLVGTTDFVLWFPENGDSPANRRSVGILVFDADEVPISAATSLPNELNVLEVGANAQGAAPYTGALRNGLSDTGFVEFFVADHTDAVTEANNSRAGVAFSLIGIAGANGEQTQTELAHERGLLQF
jgi:hypothetical protein